MCFFFFQAEDGIRDYKVTGVQTCALPICDDHDLNEQIPDAEVVLAECEAGVQQERLGLVAGAEQRYLVGVKLRFPARHHPDEMPQRPQEQDAGAPAVRPEDQELPTRLQDAMELAEDLPDLLPMKMLEHAEVVDAVERPLLERQGGDARLLDPTRARVVTGVEPQRPLGDVDGGHVDSLMEVSVHLSAAA